MSSSSVDNILSERKPRETPDITKNSTETDDADSNIPKSNNDTCKVEQSTESPINSKETSEFFNNKVSDGTTSPPLSITANTQNVGKIIARKSNEPMVEENSTLRPVPKSVVDMLRAIINLESPDDIQVHSLSAQLQTINNEADFR